MNDALKKWVLVTCALCILISIVHFAVYPLPVLSYMVVLGVAIFTYILHAWTIKSNEKGPNVFVRTFMVATFVKLLGIMGFLGLYLYLNGPFRTEVSMVTLISYVVFLFISVRTTQHVRKPNQTA